MIYEYSNGLKQSQNFVEQTTPKELFISPHSKYNIIIPIEL